MLQAEEPGWKSESLKVFHYLLKASAIWILTELHGYSSHALVTSLSPALFAAERQPRSCSALHIKGKATIGELWKNATNWPKCRARPQTECSVYVAAGAAPGARPWGGCQEQPSAALTQRNAVGKETRLHFKTPPRPHLPCFMLS